MFGINVERGIKKAMQVVVPVAVGVFIDGAFDISGRVMRLIKK
ncbi:hypothetical protein [Archaeoglobus neptunius]|nr:hypothetical protein [Archaeoglobus neptunius]